MRKGYHPSEETRKKMRVSQLGKILSEETRRKISEKRRGKCCGEDHPMFGKHLPEETKRKLSKSHSGKNHPNFGKHLPEEVRRKISKSLSGENHIYFGKHLSEEHKKNISNGNKGQIPWIKGKKQSHESNQKNREKHIGVIFSEGHRKNLSNAMKKLWEKDAKKMIKRFQLKPNGKELYLDYILQNNFPDEWKYVGDGQVVIDRLCPDFINCNGKKQIIEVFGDYWHDSKRRNVKYNQTEKGRKETFFKFGYSTLIIWEHEFTDEEKVIEKIKVFTEEKYDYK